MSKTDKKSINKRETAKCYDNKINKEDITYKRRSYEKENTKQNKSDLRSVIKSMKHDITNDILDRNCIPINKLKNISGDTTPDRNLNDNQKLNFKYFSREDLTKRNEKSLNQDTRMQRKIDKRRLLLINLPNQLHIDHLVLYLEYLSDEVDVDRLDLSKELKNTIVVTFKKDLDIISVKKKHAMKPSLLNNKIVIFPIYKPDTILIQLEKGDLNLESMLNPSKMHNSITKEILELYFSNKKRSGGENIEDIKFDIKKRLAYVKFSNHETARLVASLNHEIHNKPIKISLYYKYIGPDPFQSLPFKDGKMFCNSKNNRENHLKQDQNPGSIYHKLEDILTTTSTNNDIYTDESNTNKDTGYTLQNQNSKLFRQQNIIIKEINSVGDLSSSNYNENMIPKTSFKSILENNDNSKSRTPSIESLPIAPPQQPLTIKIPQLNLPNEKDKNINIVNYKEDNEEKDHETTTGSEDKIESDESGEINNLNNFLDTNTNNNTSTDNMNDSIKQVDPSVFLLNHLQSNNEQDRSRYYNVNPQMDEKILIQNRDQFGQPLVNLPSLDDPILSLTHEEYAHLKGIKEPPLTEVYQTNNSNNENDFSIFNDYIYKNEEDDDEINVITNNPINIDQPDNSKKHIPRPPRTSTKPIKKRPKTIIHNIKTRPPPPKILRQLSSSLSKISPDKNKNNITIIQNLNVTTSIKDNSNKSNKNTDEAFNEEEGNIGIKCKNIRPKNIKIISQYGPITLASNLKVDKDNILFLKYTSYINQLRDKYKKVNINLNENLKQVYIFGASDQVKELKNKMENDFKKFFKYEFMIEKEELAKFMQKTEIRKKIFHYLNLLLSGKDYAQVKFKQSKINSNLKDQENQIKIPLNDINIDFCSYDVDKGVDEYVLTIYTNSKDNTILFNKFLIESIRVNLKLKLKDDTAYLIRYNYPKWANFYSKYYQDLLDYKIEPLNTIESTARRKNFENNQVKLDWYLKLTGFKEDLANFISDFRKNF